jgi:hypothetical protein
MNNEHDASPDFNSEYSFGGLTICGNLFVAIDVASWFNWIVIKPYGTGHFIQGLNVSGNVFRSHNGSVDRIDHVDETYASLDMNRARNVVMEGNTFNGVNEPVFNPLTFRHTEGSDASSWSVSTEKQLPFGGLTKSMVGLVPDGKIIRGTNTRVTEFPYTALKQGADQDELAVKWSVACRGLVHLTVRMDTPT